MGKRIKTYLLIGIGILLAFQWPPGPGGTAPTDIVLMLAIIYAWPTFWKHRKIIRFPLILPMSAMFLGSLFATMISLDRLGSIVVVIQDLYFYLCFLTLVNMIDDEADFLTIRKAWLLVACLEGLLLVLAIVGIGRSLFVMPLKVSGTPIPGTAGESNRAMGTVGHANQTGLYMMMSFFVLLSIRYPQRTWQRVLIGLLLLAGMFTTGSNAAILGCLMGVFIVLVYRIARSGGRSPLLSISITAALGGVACLVIIIAIVGVPPIIVDFTQGTFLENSIARLLAGSPVRTRTRNWTAGWEAYLGHPLGLGPGAFPIWGGGGSLHSDYLSYLVEKGPLAFIGLLLLYVEVLTCLKSSIQLADTPEKQFEVVVLGAALLASASAGVSHEVMHWRHHWLLITLVFAQNRLLRIQRDESEEVVRARSWLSSRPPA